MKYSIAGKESELTEEENRQIEAFFTAAAKPNLTEVENQLRENSWLLKATNQDGKTAYDLASTSGSQGVAQFLLQEQEKIKEPDLASEPVISSFKREDDLASIAPPRTTPLAFAGGVGDSEDVDEEEKKKKKAELVTYSSYENIKKDLDFSKSPLAEKKISATQTRFGDVADGGTVLETYDEQKGFQYKIEPNEAQDSPSKVYKIEVPRMDTDGKIIPDEVDTLVFNRNGQLLEYKEPQEAKGGCRLDQEWLRRLIAEREAALTREQSGVQISADVGKQQVISGATIGEVDSAVSSNISTNVVKEQGRSVDNVPEVVSNPIVSATKVKAPAKPLSEREIFKKQMQKAQREQDKALLKRANATPAQNVQEEKDTRNEMVKSIKERQKIEEFKENRLARKIQKKFRAFKRFKDSATVVEGGTTITPEPGPKVVDTSQRSEIKR